MNLFYYLLFTKRRIPSYILLVLSTLEAFFHNNRGKKKLVKLFSVSFKKTYNCFSR